MEASRSCITGAQSTPSLSVLLGMQSEVFWVRICTDVYVSFLSVAGVVLDPSLARSAVRFMASQTYISNSTLVLLLQTSITDPSARSEQKEICNGLQIVLINTSLSCLQESSHLSRLDSLSC